MTRKMTISALAGGLVLIASLAALAIVVVPDRSPASEPNSVISRGQAIVARPQLESEPAGRSPTRQAEQPETAGAGTGAEDAAAIAQEAELDRLIEVFAGRVAERRLSIEYRQLGSLLLQRADERSGLDDYRAALDAFTASLDLDPDHPIALVSQGRAALGVHDFAAALAAADAMGRAHPDDRDGLALAGDVAYAVGDYDRAAAAYEALATNHDNDPAVLVRLAQLATLGSRADLIESERLATSALAAARIRDLSPGELAYYQTFAGRLAFERGDFVEATSLLEQAVANAPNDHGALGELARVRSATGDPEAAIALLVRANELVPEPDHLVLLGDLRAGLGHTEAAAADYSAAVALATQDDDHRRAWARSLATYLLDHGGDVAWAADIAANERLVRHDLGAFDLSAWAAYRAGDVATARRAIDAALALGPTNALVWYHAAVISAAEGDEARAAVELDAALELNPAFDPLLANDARRLRAELLSRTGAGHTTSIHGVFVGLGRLELPTA